MADIVIKSRDMYTQYYYDDEYDEYYWDGSLESAGLNAGTMYMIYTPVACSVELEGTPANLSEYEFTLTQGWNWVSFPSAEAMDLEDALADFEAEEHDVLKSRFMYTEYYYDDEYDEYYWDGSLTQLTPGDGLMFYSANSNPRPLTWGSSAKAHKANTTVQGLRSKVQMQSPQCQQPNNNALILGPSTKVNNPIGSIYINSKTNIIEDISSTCELVADFLFYVGDEIDEDVAKCLITGIFTDTGKLSYACAMPETFEIVSKLLKLSKTTINEILYPIYNSVSMEEFELRKYGYSKVEFFDD